MHYAVHAGIIYIKKVEEDNYQRSKCMPRKA